MYWFYYYVCVLFVFVYTNSTGRISPIYTNLLLNLLIIDLLNGDVSDIEEFDEGDDIAYENLDELLLELPDTVENDNGLIFNNINEDIIQVQMDDIPFEDFYVPDVEKPEPESESIGIEQVEFFREVLRPPKWEKVFWSSPDDKCTGKLPKAHNILVYSPYEYFKLFVDHDITENMYKQTNVYSVQTNREMYNTICSEIQQFLGINIYLSIIKMPQYRMFWSNESRFPTVADTMSRNRFDNLGTFFHVNDNTEMLPLKIQYFLI